MRIYQAAQQLGVASKDLLDLLKGQGVDVKSPASSIDDATLRMAEKLLSGGAVAVLAPAPVAEQKTKGAETPLPIPPPKSSRPSAIPAAKGGAKPSVVESPRAEAAPSVVEQSPVVEEPAAAPELVEEAPAAPPPPVKAAPIKIAPGKTPMKVMSSKTPAAKTAPVKAAPAKAPPAAPVEEIAAAPEPEPEAPEEVEPTAAPPAPAAPIPEPIRRLGSIPTSAPRPPSMQPIGRAGGSAGASTGTGASAGQRRPREPLRPATGQMMGLAPGGVRRPVGPVAPKKPEAAGQRPVITYQDALRQQTTPGRPGSVATPGGRVPGTAEPPGKKPVGAPDFEEEKGKKKPPQRGRGGIADREGRKASRQTTGRIHDDDDDFRIRRKRQQQQQKIVSTGGPIVLDSPITVRTFSAQAGVRADVIQKKLFSTMGVIATINAGLSEEQAQLLALDLGIEIQIKGRQTAETRMEEKLIADVGDPADLVPRPPIVTFMGHVDHGKTSLMDRIRRTNVVSGEAGGITQHIGAYQVKLESGAAVTFLDTPGHQAFTAMRARGANVTDIVVLVVAADDGVMPQTEEAISHAQAAGVPIVVAMNKSDLPGANPEKLQQQLAKFNLIAEQWGGDTIMVPTSATTGKGVPELLETLHLVAELKDLKANPKRAAAGNCIEASLDPDSGVTATFLVRTGTLRRGDVVLCGSCFGKVRAMYDDLGVSLDEAGPSTPVVLFGLDEVPEAGEPFVVLDDVAKAREIGTQRKSRSREVSRAPDQIRTLETLFEKKLQDLAVIIKADVRGSLEALRKELGQFQHNEVQVKIIRDGVGAVSESDVLLAHASNAIIIAFNVIADDKAVSLAVEKEVEIRRYEIIYQILDDIKKALEGLLKPESREVQLGRAVVRKVYPISRVGTVAGCSVVQGTIERSGKLRVIRDGVVVGAYPIETLRRVKDDVKEVREGLECGIKLAGFNDVKLGDLFEAYKIEEVKRTL